MLFSAIPHLTIFCALKHKRQKSYLVVFGPAKWCIPEKVLLQAFWLKAIFYIHCSWRYLPVIHHWEGYMSTSVLRKILVLIIFSLITRNVPGNAGCNDGVSTPAIGERILDFWKFSFHLRCESCIEMVSDYLLLLCHSWGWALGRSRSDWQSSSDCSTTPVARNLTNSSKIFLILSRARWTRLAKTPSVDSCSVFC